MTIAPQLPRATPSILATPRPLSEQIATLLAERIHFGELKPGQRITEDQVERWSGFSRSPVREAFRRLEYDGLVRRATHRGVTVTRIEPAELEDIYAMRALLGSQMAALAAERATPQDLSVIAQRVADLARVGASGDLRVTIRTYLGFSEAIYAAARSTSLQTALRMAGAQVLRFRYMVFQDSRAALDASLQSLEAIAIAIHDRDPAAAASLTRQAVEVSWQRTWALAGDRASEPPRSLPAWGFGTN